MTVGDLRTVDELCRLAVVARGLGCRFHLVGTDPNCDRSSISPASTTCWPSARPPRSDPSPRRSTKRDVTLSEPALDIDEFETHRRELIGYCYRMLGSGAEAEDAV